MTEPIDYPDFEPDTLGDLKEIKRITGMQKHAPKIKWGDEYNSWAVERRLAYAEKLASSMNHAADILQQERNALLENHEHQEAVLKQETLDRATLVETMNRELAAVDLEKQELYTEITEAKDNVRRLKLVCQAARATLGKEEWAKVRSAADGD